MNLRYQFAQAPCLIAALTLLPFLDAFNGCFGEAPDSFPLLNSVDDRRTKFAIDPNKPWQFSFGRGSGWRGLEAVRIETDGKVVLYRFAVVNKGNSRIHVCENATHSLPKEAVAKLLSDIDELRVMDMKRSYNADVRDGTQWIVWIQQGENRKTIYCNNHFPEPIIDLAKRLDEMLTQHGVDKLKWSPVTDEEYDSLQNELWDSLK